MNILLRQAVAADVPAIVRFNIALARESEGLVLKKPIVTAGVQSVLAAPGYGFYVVAENAEKIVGCTMITYEWSDWRNQAIWWLQSVYVDPALRRQGVFSKLYHFILELAMHDGAVASLRLYAEKSNRTAFHAYRKLGMAENSYRIFEHSLTRTGASLSWSGCTGGARRPHCDLATHFETRCWQF